MPNFRLYGVEVDVDVDVDVDEFLDDCSEGDIKDIITWLKANDYLENTNINIPGYSTDNLMDITYKKALAKLQDKRIYLTLEEEQFIINLASKY